MMETSLVRLSESGDQRLEGRVPTALLMSVPLNHGHDPSVQCGRSKGET